MDSLSPFQFLRISNYGSLKMLTQNFRVAWWDLYGSAWIRPSLVVFRMSASRLSFLDIPLSNVDALEGKPRHRPPSRSLSISHHFF